MGFGRPSPEISPSVSSSSDRKSDRASFSKEFSLNLKVVDEISFQNSSKDRY